MVVYLPVLRWWLELIRRFSAVVAVVTATLAVLPAEVAATPSQATPIDVGAEIAANRLPIDRLPNGGFAGRGWRQLVEDARQAQFTMVGEQHGSASIAEVEIALHRELARGGYDHLALEIGPYSTEYAESLLRRSRGGLRSYLQTPGHGFILPFLFFSEELPLVEQMVALSPDRKQALWGVDQEFAGSGLLHAELLARRAKTPRQRAAVEEFRRRASANRILVATLTSQEVAELKKAFASDPWALRLVESLIESAAVYSPFLSNQPVYSANLAREAMMKSNFARAFATAEARMAKPPKVFLKFGGSHAMRGHSSTYVPSFTNYLMEWGQSRGFRLVNLMIDCDGGEALNAQSGRVEPCESYFGRDNILAKVVQTGPSLQLIHLAPLRSRLGTWKNIDPTTRQTILAFDYFIVVRGSRAASPTGKLN